MAIYSHNDVVPLLGRDVFVAPSATVIGDVHLGDESSVWFGAVLRGDVFPIRFGARTNVQDGSVVHVTGGQAATTVGDDVTVGHMVLLHGCTVGNRCLIGMGSVLLDGAEIGDDCLVAAGSLVTPRTKIPPRSLVVGRPAKRVREVNDADLKMISEGSRLYREYSRTFRSSAVKLIAP
jgi:carbonic anhydrase/acetyltransferase-like protein (isoleucine patch superfamily)